MPPPKNILSENVSFAPRCAQKSLRTPKISDNLRGLSGRDAGPKNFRGTFGEFLGKGVRREGLSGKNLAFSIFKTVIFVRKCEISFPGRFWKKITKISSIRLKLSQIGNRSL